MNYLQRKKLAFLSIVNSVKGFVRTITGIPPLTLPNCVDDKSVIDYKLYGDSLQNGTPSPDNPIEVVSVGEKTKNLVSELLDGYVNIGDNFGTLYNPQNGVFKTIHLKNLKAGSYTLSFEKSISTTRCVTTNFHDSNVSISTAPQYNTTYCVVTLTQDEDDFYFSFRDVTSATTQWGDAWVQCEEGNVATEYEPYGYKLPITARGKNLFDKNKPLDAVRNGYPPNITVDGDTNIITGILGGNTARMGAWIIPTNGATDFVFSAKNISIEGTSKPTVYIRESDAFPEYIGTVSTFGSNITQIYASTKSKQFKTSSAYIAIVFQIVNDGVITFDSLQIEEGTTATEYEPYVEPITTNIYLDEPLRKIGDYTDTIDFEKGKVVRNIKSIDAEPNGWSSYNDGGGKYATKTYMLPDATLTNNNGYHCMCNRFIGKTRMNIYNGIEGIETNASQIRLYYAGITDMAIVDFKEWAKGNPIIVDYILETPTEEVITLPTLPTHKGTTIYEVNTTIQPSNMEVTYYSTQKGE